MPQVLGKKYLTLFIMDEAKMYLVKEGGSPHKDLLATQHLTVIQ
jgi:hypothetical protein